MRVRQCATRFVCDFGSWLFFPFKLAELLHQLRQRTVRLFWVSQPSEQNCKGKVNYDNDKVKRLSGPSINVGHH